MADALQRPAGPRAEGSCSSQNVPDARHHRGLEVSGAELSDSFRASAWRENRAKWGKAEGPPRCTGIPPVFLYVKWPLIVPSQGPRAALLIPVQVPGSILGGRCRERGEEGEGPGGGKLGARRGRRRYGRGGGGRGRTWREGGGEGRGERGPGEELEFCAPLHSTFSPASGTEGKLSL